MRRAGAAASLAALIACNPASSPKASPPPTSPAKSETSSALAPASAPVVIVGGGIAGLVTAHELKKRGVMAHVLEASDVWGGRIQTADYGGGLKAEFGLQELWGDNPLLQVAKELNVELDGDVEPPYSSMILDGKVYPYLQDTTDEYFAAMMKPEEVKQLKDWMAKATVLRETALKDGLRSADIAAMQKLSFKDWIEGFKMSSRVNDWIRITIECELAYPWTLFSAVEGLLEYGVFLKGGEPNYHVKGGNSRLVEALVQELGDRATSSAVVSRIERKDGHARVHYMKNRQQRVIEAQRVVVAVPFWRLHQIDFAPPISADRWAAINSLMRGQYTVVHLIMSKEARKVWEVGGDPFPVLADGPLSVIYGVMSDSPAESKTEVFSFLVHGYAAQSWHMVPREVKLKELLGKMDEHWPGFSKYVESSYVYGYHPGSIAVWPPGRSPLDEQHAKLREPELGQWLVGDWLYSGHSDGAARSAMEAAEAISKELAAKR
ncbi:MAG: FAD-dependent oxidoreductase [Deltaproteobacteria bacterium]|nr:FAD-dependent oxidoreductase [Deltaproteobacteria bacterium]